LTNQPKLFNFQNLFLVKFVGIFGQPKRHQIVWFLGQLKACNVYYKSHLMLCLIEASKSAKLAQNSSHDQLAMCVPLLLRIFWRLFQQFMPTFPATTCFRYHLNHHGRQLESPQSNPWSLFFDITTITSSSLITLLT